jgi:hypothetical protein
MQEVKCLISCPSSPAIPTASTYQVQWVTSTNREDPVANPTVATPSLEPIKPLAIVAVSARTKLLGDSWWNEMGRSSVEAVLEAPIFATLFHHANLIYEPSEGDGKTLDWGLPTYDASERYQGTSLPANTAMGAERPAEPSAQPKRCKDGCMTSPHQVVHSCPRRDL